MDPIDSIFCWHNKQHRKARWQLKNRQGSPIRAETIVLNPDVEAMVELEEEVVVEVEVEMATSISFCTSCHQICQTRRRHRGVEHACIPSPWGSSPRRNPWGSRSLPSEKPRFHPKSEGIEGLNGHRCICNRLEKKTNMAPRAHLGHTKN